MLIDEKVFRNKNKGGTKNKSPGISRGFSIIFFELIIG